MFVNWALKPIDVSCCCFRCRFSLFHSPDSQRRSVSHPPRLLCQMFHVYSLCLSFGPPHSLFQRLIFSFPTISSLLLKNTLSNADSREDRAPLTFSSFNSLMFTSHIASPDPNSMLSRHVVESSYPIPLQQSVVPLLFLYFEVSIEICQRSTLFQAPHRAQFSAFGALYHWKCTCEFRIPAGRCTYICYAHARLDFE